MNRPINHKMNKSLTVDLLLPFHVLLRGIQIQTSRNIYCHLRYSVPEVQKKEQNVTSFKVVSTILIPKLDKTVLHIRNTKTHV